MRKKNPIHPETAGSRPTNPGWSLFIVLAAMFTLAAVGGCDAQEHSHEGHAHAEEGHDHDHAHAGHDHDGHEDHPHDDDEHVEHPAGQHEEEHADEIVLTAEAVRRNGIRIAVAREQSLASSFIAPARVAFDADRLVHISSVVTGRVVEVKARVGDAVSKGDVLLVVHSPELGEAQSDFLQKRTAAEVARPGAEVARSAFERAQSLYEKNGGIALGDVQKRQAEHVAAQGAMRSAIAALTAAENRLHLLGLDQAAVEELIRTGEINPRYDIAAPIDGRVIEREATLGELVGPEKEKLMQIADLSSVWVLADVPEGKLAQIPENATVTVTVPATGAEPLKGVVSYISTELDPATRTARLRMEVPNPDNRLRPGMFARAEVSVGQPGEPVVAIAEEAVQTVDGKATVFVPVEGEPNTFIPQPVEVGPSTGGMVPVNAGLTAGQRYVSSGSFILKAELGKAGAAHEH